MSREEAIKAIQDFIGWFKEDSLIRKALDMAIQALSQEPCDECRNKRTSFCGNCKEYDEFEPCDDVVSRKLAIRAIKNLYPDIPRVDFNGAKRKWADKYAQYIECERLIEQLPPVTQKSVIKYIKADLINEANEHMTEGDYNDGVRFGLMLAEQIICRHCGKEQK